MLQTLIGLVSVLNGALIQSIMASRVLYGMARRGWLPPVLGRVNRYIHTPLLATLFISAAILLFALGLPLLSLAKLTSLMTLCIFTMVNLSLWRFKARQRQNFGFTEPYWMPVMGVFIGYQLVHWLGTGR